MKIGIAVFAYNRGWHLQQVIDGLQKNRRVDKLYLFHDGLQCEDHRKEWEKVRHIIEDISWCEKVCVFSADNKGLAKSILDGIDFVLEENEAIIVLEDDCVPRKNFISFMKQCFDRYKGDKNIYSITGYSWPIELQGRQYDIYGCGRICSWGWGTWKDRWRTYKKDYELIRTMKRDKNMSRNLAVWGADLEETVIGNVRGTFDSWAVFWALNVIARQGICINPYHSLIQNIGMDGTGVHCGVTGQFDIECMDEEKEEFSFPVNINILRETEEAFAPFLGSYTAINEVGSKTKILVYGVGVFYLKNEEKVNRDYYVEKFVDRRKSGYFAGKEIIKPSEIQYCDFEKIVIMIQDQTETNYVVNDLVEKYYIPREKIELGNIRYLDLDR